MGFVVDNVVIIVNVIGNYRLIVVCIVFKDIDFIIIFWVMFYCLYCISFRMNSNVLYVVVIIVEYFRGFVVCKWVIFYCVVVMVYMYNFIEVVIGVLCFFYVFVVVVYGDV